MCGYLLKKFSCLVVYIVLEGCAYFTVDDTCEPGSNVLFGDGSYVLVQFFAVFGLSG